MRTFPLHRRCRRVTDTPAPRSAPGDPALQLAPDSASAFRPSRPGYRRRSLGTGLEPQPRFGPHLLSTSASSAAPVPSAQAECAPPAPTANDIAPLPDSRCCSILQVSSALAGSRLWPPALCLLATVFVPLVPAPRIVRPERASPARIAAP